MKLLPWEEWWLHNPLDDEPPCLDNEFCDCESCGYFRDSTVSRQPLTKTTRGEISMKTKREDTLKTIDEFRKQLGKMEDFFEGLGSDSDLVRAEQYNAYKLALKFNNLWVRLDRFQGDLEDSDDK